MKILFDAVGIDHAVVSQHDPRLPIEKGHVAVQFEELSADRFARHLQPLDRPAADQVPLDDLVEISFRLDPIEHPIGPKQYMHSRAFHARAAGAEATGRSHAYLRAQPGPLQTFGQQRAETGRALPTASLAAADEQFVLALVGQRPIEHVLGHRLTAQHMASEDFVNLFAGDPLVLHRQLMRDHHPDDRFATAPARASGKPKRNIGSLRGRNVFAELVEHVVGAGRLFTGG